jgi:hypothetical protein
MSIVNVCEAPDLSDVHRHTPLCTCSTRSAMLELAKEVLSIPSSKEEGSSSCTSNVAMWEKLAAIQQHALCCNAEDKDAWFASLSRGDFVGLSLSLPPPPPFPQPV